MTSKSRNALPILLSTVWGLGHSYLGHMGRGFIIFLLLLTTISIINIFTFEFSYPKYFLLIVLIFYWIFTIYDLKRLYKTNISDNKLQNSEGSKSYNNVICKNCLAENENYSKYCNKCYFNLHAITNRKKEIKLFLVGIALLFLFFHFYVEPHIINGGFTGIVPFRYHNIEMVHPSNWDVVTRDSEDYESGEDPISDSLVTISAPVDTASRISPALLSISIDNLLINLPLSNTSLSPLDNDDVIFLKIDFKVPLDEFSQNRFDTIKKDHPNIQLKHITIANKNAYEINYTINSNNKALKVTQAWTIYDNQLYIISYYIEESKYDIYYPYIKRMLRSLELRL